MILSARVPQPTPLLFRGAPPKDRGANCGARANRTNICNQASRANEWQAKHVQATHRRSFTKPMRQSGVDNTHARVLMWYLSGLGERRLRRQSPQATSGGDSSSSSPLEPNMLLAMDGGRLWSDSCCRSLAALALLMLASAGLAQPTMGGQPRAWAELHDVPKHGVST